YSSVFGMNSRALVDYGTAIGYKSYADRAAWNSSSNNYSAAFAPSDMSALNNKQKTVWQATSAALAVGDPNGTGGTVITRQITGVAAGSEDTDAVNVAQLKELKTNTDTQITAAGTAAQDWVNAQGFAKAADLPCSYDANGNLSCGKNENNGVSASTENATVLGTGNNQSVSGNTTVGGYSVAVGFNNNFSYDEDITVGKESTAVGNGNFTSGNGSTAVGSYNAAIGEDSTAVGSNNFAEGNYSSVFGMNSRALVDYGTAIGYKSYADRAAWDSDSNNYSAAFAPSDMSGFNEKQKAVWQSTSAALAVGDPNGDGNSSGTPITRQITGVAAGSQDTDAVNVAQLKEVADMVGSGGGGTAFSPITVSGNSGNFTVGSAGKLNIQGDNTNITTTAESGTVKIDLSSALKTQITSAIATVGTLNTTVSGLDTTVKGLQTELDKKAEQSAVDSLQTELGKKANQSAVDSLQTELGKKANQTAVDNLQTELGKKADKTWVTDEINKAALSGTGVDLSEYAKTADANAYADTAANTAETNAKGYTDSEVAKAKTAANTYADTAANQAKTDAQTYADNAVKDKATQSWVKDEINKAALSGTGVDLSEYAKTADA
ncbi:MAG: hypothetical protein J6T41_01035, partial [Neisseriaceae bacterium]|nr:hypothetical protein [Neisseriaceae bacterium]